MLVAALVGVLLLCVDPMVNAALPSSIMLHTGGSKAKIVGKFPPGIDGALYGYPDQKIGGLIVEVRA